MKRVPVGDIEEFGREGHPRRAVCRERARAVLLRRLKTQAAIGSRIGRREDFSVSVPGLPGCWSQGATEAEAVENIKSAIHEYLAVVEEQLEGERTREVEVD